MQGQSLSASSGSWTGTTPITFIYVWQQCKSIGAGCANIAGATAQTHTLSIDDVGHTLRVAVTARNVAGAVTADSATTAVVIGAVPPQNTALPQITGGSTIGPSSSRCTGRGRGARRSRSPSSGRAAT